LGLVIFIAGLCLVIGWPVYPVFVVTLIMIPIGKYIHDPAVQAYLGERVPYQRRGAVLASLEFGWSLAFILGIPLMGYLIQRFGWLGPFPTLALLGLLCLGGLAWMLPRDPKPQAGQPGMRQNLSLALTSLPALLGLAMGFFFSAANETVTLMFGVWMEDSFSLKIAAIGAASAVMGLSELGGEGLTVFLVDRLGKPFAIGIGLVANCLAAIGLPLLGHTLPGALVGLFLFYITFEYTVVSTIPLMSEVVPSARATLMALYASSHSIGRALGALIAAPLYQMGFVWCCLVAVVLNLLAFAALLKLRENMREKGFQGDVSVN
jgi:predicted MFS family arabinose efflux permease